MRNTPNDDADPTALRDRADALGAQIEAAQRQRRGADEQNANSGSSHRGAEMAWRIVIGMLVALLLCGAIGMWVDRTVGSAPIGIILGVLLGFGVGVRLAIREAIASAQAANAQSNDRPSS